MTDDAEPDLEVKTWPRGGTGRGVEWQWGVYPAGSVEPIATGRTTGAERKAKAAGVAAKARSVKLGGDRGGRNTQAHREAAAAASKAKANDRAADVAPAIAELRAAGATTLRAIADGLNAKRITTPRGGQWSAVQVSRVLERVAV